MMPKNRYHQYETDERVSTDLRFTVYAICVFICIVFALTIFIDIQIDKGQINIPSWVSVGNIDDARVLVSSIIGSVSTVLGLVFSVVLLVISMASSQFGPRLLRRFTLENNGQGTIGLFAGTFLFSLFTLIAMHLENGVAFIPQITIFTCVLLMILSFGALIAFSQSIRRGIQIGNLLASVSNDLSLAVSRYLSTRKVLEKHYADHISDEQLNAINQRNIEEGYPILAQLAGYLQSVDHHALILDASKQEAMITLTVRPGNFVIQNTVIAHVFPKEKGMALCDRIENALSVGPNRTLTQDPEFAIAQIVEIGTRALSSAVNDPFTGLTCIDWLASNILSLIDVPETISTYHDAEGHLCLIEPALKFSRLVSGAFDMIRESGAKDPAIMIRLLQNFMNIGKYLNNNRQRRIIMRQVSAIKESVGMQTFTQTDLNDIKAAYEKAVSVLAEKT